MLSLRALCLSLPLRFPTSPPSLQRARLQPSVRFTPDHASASASTSAVTSRCPIGGSDSTSASDELRLGFSPCSALSLFPSLFTTPLPFISDLCSLPLHHRKLPLFILNPDPSSLLKSSARFPPLTAEASFHSLSTPTPPPPPSTSPIGGPDLSSASDELRIYSIELEVVPDCGVLQSGTGSGSLTTSLAKTVAPTGRGYTFDFHEQRAASKLWLPPVMSRHVQQFTGYCGPDDATLF